LTINHNGEIISRIFNNSDDLTAEYSLIRLPDPISITDLPDENLYRFVAYSHNREPVIMDSIAPIDGDTIKFKFGFEYPYRFIGIKIDLELGDCLIKKDWYQSNNSNHEEIYTYSTARQYDMLPIDDAFSNDSNRYYFKFKYFYYGESESADGAIIDFNIENDSISTFILHTCQFIQSDNIIGFDNLSLSLNRLDFNIRDNEFSIGLDDAELQKCISSISQKDQFSAQYGSYRSNSNLEKINSWKDSKLKISLFLF